MITRVSSLAKENCFSSHLSNLFLMQLIVRMTINGMNACKEPLVLIGVQACSLPTGMHTSTCTHEHACTHTHRVMGV